VQGPGLEHVLSHDDYDQHSTADDHDHDDGLHDERSG
jgi:hypothetical protein